ncbi:MAG: ankyrin repeat domain-containing protein, partial [Myxococcaceae bacterium]
MLRNQEPLKAKKAPLFFDFSESNSMGSMEHILSRNLGKFLSVGLESAKSLKTVVEMREAQVSEMKEIEQKDSDHQLNSRWVHLLLVLSRAQWDWDTEIFSSVKTFIGKCIRILKIPGLSGAGSATSGGSQETSQASGGILLAPDEEDSEIGPNAFFRAVIEGHPDTVRKLISTMTLEEITATDSDGLTALEYATEHNHLEIKEILTKTMSLLRDVEQIRSNPSSATTLFKKAVMLGSQRALDLLWEFGVDPSESSGGMSFVMWAVRNSDENILLWLINHGANPNTDTADTALGWAIRNRLTHHLPILLQAGADLNRADKYNKKPSEHVRESRPEIQPIFADLMIQAVNADDEVRLQELIAAGFDLNWKNNDGYTAFSQAVYLGNEHLVGWLLQQPGIDLNIQDNDGNMPLHWATNQRKISVAKLLLDYPNIIREPQNNLGRSPLYIAILNDALTMVDFLVRRGHNPYVLDIQGRTALHAAAAEGNFQVVRYFLSMPELFADLCGIQDAAGKTASELAMENGHQEITELLESNQDCAICTAPLMEEGACALRQSCGHSFHRGCINRWFQESRTRNCPTCREAAPVNDDPLILFLREILMQWTWIDPAYRHRIETVLRDEQALSLNPSIAPAVQSSRPRSITMMGGG